MRLGLLACGVLPEPPLCKGRWPGESRGGGIDYRLFFSPAGGDGGLEWFRRCGGE